MEGIVPLCRVQLESHLKMRHTIATQGETVQRLRLLSENYNRKVELVKEVVGRERRWSFQNAFLVVDRHEQNRVTQEDWVRFGEEIKVNLKQKSMVGFYHVYARNNCMRYSHFLKIFKSKATQQVMT